MEKSWKYDSDKLLYFFTDTEEFFVLILFALSTVSFCLFHLAKENIMLYKDRDYDFMEKAKGKYSQNVCGTILEP